MPSTVIACGRDRAACLATLESDFDNSPCSDSLDFADCFHNTRNMETKFALTALTGLAQETRLAIFRLLVEQGPEGMAAGALAERLGLANATLSFHLKEL
ncbi:MAG: helix-turn-helix domain-containing protein, partial [Casimicrobiaceae bacterium]